MDLTVTEVRALLGDVADGLTDAEVLALCEEAAAFARVVVRGYIATGRSRTRGDTPRRPRLRERV